MIDIHSHIIPGLDDGAGNAEEALEMARAAVADGLTHLVATPHSSYGAGPADRVAARVQELQKMFDHAGIALRLLTGQEVWISSETLSQYHAGRVFGINNGPYMLVEFPPHYVPRDADDIIAGLQQEGLRPVLAHPERNASLQQDLAPLAKLIGQGVLAQLTGGSLLGAFGSVAQETAEAMLAHNMAHVIASDSHSATMRLPVLSKAMERAAKLVGEDRARSMVKAIPEAIVTGRPIDLPVPLPYRQRKHWSFWRS